MNDYMDIYLKRVNRYGEDYQTRTQGRREEDFQYLLKKSVYRIDFFFEENEYPGVFTPYSQNETKTLHYLLTERILEIPNGTILFLPEKIADEKTENPWLVFYKENIVASGYNKYVMLRLSHEIEWTNKKGETCRAWAYFHGGGASSLKDSIESGSIQSVYSEDSNSFSFITATNENIAKDDYFVVRKGTSLQKAYRVTGYEFDSSLGVEYVTVDPIYVFDETPAPQDDGSDDFFWLRGGDTSGST